MVSTPALIGPKSRDGASLDRCCALRTRAAEDTPSLDLILSLKSILRLREINEHPSLTITRDPGIVHARTRMYVYTDNLWNLLNYTAPRWVDE